jgi:hypothetical protein
MQNIYYFQISIYLIEKMEIYLKHNFLFGLNYRGIVNREIIQFSDGFD